MSLRKLYVVVWKKFGALPRASGARTHRLRPGGPSKDPSQINARFHCNVN
jgi:hypothetical protein